MPPVMENLDPSLVVQCFDFIQSIASQKVGKFSFKLTIGHSQFSFDSREGEQNPARTAPAEARYCHKTPSKMRRNARRREQFLQKKLSSPVSPTSSPMTPHPDRDIHSSGQSEKEKVIDSDTKTPRLRNREEGRKFSYITRSISALKQQIEFNRRCIGVFTTSLPFSSRNLDKFGINEDDVVRDSGCSDRFRLPPDKCSFQEPSQCGIEAEIQEDVIHCEMCYKPMSQDHQCWKLLNEGKVISFVAIHDFKQLCCLCFAEQSKKCSIAKHEASLLIQQNQTMFFLASLSSHFSTKHKLTVSFSFAIIFT